MPEDVFWKTMTPVRFARLVAAHFKNETHQRSRPAAQEPPRQPSLYQYLTGGGG